MRWALWAAPDFILDCHPLTEILSGERLSCSGGGSDWRSERLRQLEWGEEYWDEEATQRKSSKRLAQESSWVCWNVKSHMHRVKLHETGQRVTNKLHAKQFPELKQQWEMLHIWHAIVADSHWIYGCKLILEQTQLYLCPNKTEISG